MVAVQEATLEFLQQSEPPWGSHCSPTDSNYHVEQTIPLSLYHLSSVLWDVLKAQEGIGTITHVTTPPHEQVLAFCHFAQYL